MDQLQQNSNITTCFVRESTTYGSRKKAKVEKIINVQRYFSCHRCIHNYWKDGTRLTATCCVTRVFMGSRVYLERVVCIRRQTFLQHKSDEIVVYCVGCVYHMMKKEAFSQQV